MDTFSVADVRKMIKTALVSAREIPAILHPGVRVIIAEPGHHRWTVPSLWKGGLDEQIDLIPCADSESICLVGFGPQTETFVIAKPEPRKGNDLPAALDNDRRTE